VFAQYKTLITRMCATITNICIAKKKKIKVSFPPVFQVGNRGTNVRGRDEEGPLDVMMSA
jgi:hypothetical protein